MQKILMERIETFFTPLKGIIIGITSAYVSYASLIDQIKDIFGLIGSIFGSLAAVCSFLIMSIKLFRKVRGLVIECRQRKADKRSQDKKD